MWTVSMGRRRSAHRCGPAGPVNPDYRFNALKLPMLLIDGNDALKASLWWGCRLLQRAQKPLQPRAGALAAAGE